MCYKYLIVFKYMEGRDHLCTAETLNNTRTVFHILRRAGRFSKWEKILRQKQYEDSRPCVCWKWARPFNIIPGIFFKDEKT